MARWQVTHISLRPTPPRVEPAIEDGAVDERDIEGRALRVPTSQSHAPEDEDAAPLHLTEEMYCPSGVKRLPLWHERWPAAELAKARDRNLRSFQRAYGQRPIADHAPDQ